jgi:holo-[acyl-carrier protein] synthase
MNIKGIGADIADIKRFRKLPYKSNSDFYKKIFTEAEIKYCLRKDDPYPSFAARFAAKEAVIKALGSTVYRARSVEILNEKSGKPTVKVKSQKSKVKIMVSLSHTNDYAIAFALWLN